MTTCGNCTHWSRSATDERIGTCGAPVPAWLAHRHFQSGPLAKDERWPSCDTFEQGHSNRDDC